MELLDTEFWDTHWDEMILPQTVNYNFKLERLLAGIFKKYLPDGENKKEILEVGCAPGKWLVFFAKEMNYKVSGLDFSQQGVKKTYENFNLTNITGEVISGDIFTIEKTKKYDVVYSLGFIEHFTNVDEVIQKHLEFLKPNGHLVLGIPNFKGLNFLLQKMLDTTVIDDHNLKIMNKNFLLKTGETLHLTPSFIKFIGGFDPLMFVPKNKNDIRKLYYKKSLFKRIFNFMLKLNILSYFNSRMFSSYILVVYKNHGFTP